MERISTGISGLDEMIEGGFKKNNAILVGGGCGSGKSTLGMQFLVHGAKNKAPGVYVTFEEEPEAVIENMSRHGWDLQKFIDKDLIDIIHVQPQEVMHIVNQEYGMIMDSIEQKKAKRIVIDSLTSIEMLIESEYEKRHSILRLINWLRGHGVTSLLTAEAEQDPTAYSRYGIMEFIVDGVVVLYNIRRGRSRVRALEVLKMRGTKNNTNLVPYVIDKGIQLQPKQPLFGAIDED